MKMELIMQNKENTYLKVKCSIEATITYLAVKSLDTSMSLQMLCQIGFLRKFL